MTVEELLIEPYLWSASHAELVLAIAIGFPVVATILSLLFRGGRTDADGLFIADAAAGLAMLTFAVTSVIFTAASLALDVSILQMQVGVLLSPLICALGTVFGVSRVFSLKRLYTIGLLQDTVLFLLALWAARWFMGKFWGWGIFFFGGATQILFFLIFGFCGLVFLFRRILRPRNKTPERGERNLSLT